MSRRNTQGGRVTMRADDPRHGTTNGYTNLKCRCLACRAAWRERHNEYMHRSGQLAVRNARKRGDPIPYDELAIAERLVKLGGSATPRTLAEWQYAADLAELALALDAARQFGLVTGGPDVNRERCDWVLIEAEARKIEPAPSADMLAQFIAEIQTEANQ